MPESGITEQTYYRWRKEYGGFQLHQARRLKELEQDNAKLKRPVSGMSLGNHRGPAFSGVSARYLTAIPKEAISVAKGHSLNLRNSS